MVGGKSESQSVIGHKCEQDTQVIKTSGHKIYQNACPSTKVSNLIYVFSNKNGRPYFRQGLYNIWKKANRKAHSKYGIKIISLKNATRHSLASQLANKGKSLAVIARILGNSEHVVEENYRSISVDTVAQEMGGNVTSLRPISEGSNKG